jgi:hypothetical protein
LKNYGANSILSKIILPAFLLAFFATSTPSFAQALPGEANRFNPQGAGNVHTTDAYSEARDAPTGSIAARVWQGDTDSQVWLQVGSADTRNIGNGRTETFASPAIAWYGSNQFIVTHVGSDSRLYWSLYNPFTTTSTNWAAVPQQTALGPPSLVRIGENVVFMAYLGTDLQWWGTTISNGHWANSSIIGSGPFASMGEVSPAVGRDPTTGDIWAVVARGSEVYISVLRFNSPTLTWTNWSQITSPPSIPAASPGVAFLPNGTMTVSITGRNQRIYYNEAPENGNFGHWSEDTTGWSTNNTVNLITVRNAMFALFVGFDNLGYDKQVTSQ